ncbi:hypothetical protein PPYR_15083, partial [Photinus pyralis]
VTRGDRIRNDSLRSELGVDAIVQNIKNQQLRWFGHLNGVKEMPVKRIREANI